MQTILPEHIGYVIIIAVGLSIATVISLLIKAEKKWLGIKQTFDWFFTAGRVIKTGLLASSIVSAWVWAATLLESSTVTFQFGIGGPFWYAAGATIPIILFSIIAVKVKQSGTLASTFPEILYQRYGPKSHKVFLFFGMMTNTIVTSMLVLGGAAAINALTGININIVCLMLPIGIIIYTLVGGLRATFIADYINVIILFFGILSFVSLVYFLNPQIDGISGMYDKLANVSILKPVQDNAFGSYLTLASLGALVFGIINIIGNFGTVFVDQSYWQRAIAAKNKAGGPGFIIGGLVWFAIPFTLATTLGLSAVALNLDLSPDQVNHGLVAPMAAISLLGDIGAIFLLTMIITAVTSAGAAQLISVSSLVTHDIYKRYKNPAASEKHLFTVVRKLVLSFGIGMMLLGVILFQLGLNLQYVYLVMGILIGSAVGPIALGVLWKKTNRTVATLAAIIGLVVGVTTWIITSSFYGEISIHTTSQNMPLLAGNVVSILTGIVITVLGSLLRPENFQFRTDQKSSFDDITVASDSKNPKNQSKKIRNYAIVLSLVLVVFWPLPLYFSGMVFSKLAFSFWVWTAVVWAFCAAFIAIGYPLMESKEGILKVLKASIIPVIFTAIVIVAVLSYLFISSSELKYQYIDLFIFATIGIMASFGLIVLTLNRKLQRLVKLQTVELKEERDNLEKLVKQKTEELLKQEKLATIGELSARISHDLRNPLSVLQNTLKIIMVDPNAHSNPKLWERYERMSRSADRMTHQLDDVLNFLRISPVIMEPAAIDGIIEDAIEKLAIPKTVDLKTNLTKVSVKCDKTKLEAVFSNLIMNAIQAVDYNGKVHIRVVEKGNSIVIEVEDSGPEIPKEILSRLFEPLFTTKQKGTGLGLVSCKKTVEQHNGTITVRTSPTTFTIILPKNQE